MGPTWATSTPLRVTWKVSPASTWSMTEAALLRNARWVMVLMIQPQPLVSPCATPCSGEANAVRPDFPEQEGPAQLPWNVKPARRAGTTSTAEGATRHGRDRTLLSKISRRPLRRTGRMGRAPRRPRRRQGHFLGLRHQRPGPGREDTCLRRLRYRRIPARGP